MEPNTEQWGQLGAKWPFYFPQKCRLGPQNGSKSLGPKKLPKIINCATIKETKKLKEIVLASKWNRKVATNFHLCHQPC